MSEPSPEDWQKLLGRVAALEFLSAQQWATVLSWCPAEAREEFMMKHQAKLEEKLAQIPRPIVTQSGLDCVDRIFSSALYSCRQLDFWSGKPPADPK